jgi:hypothetical protein
MDYETRESRYSLPKKCIIIDHKVKIKGENKGFRLEVEINFEGSVLLVKGEKVMESYETTIVEVYIKVRGPARILSKGEEI